jgi:3D-(3,5/4)-trihydroxycyclohexane-1,2-dione acylhydrolase (decyclizing)
MHEGPDAEVFVIVGDGSLLMAPGELLTAVQEGLKVTLVVVDNAGFGSIDALARTTTGVSLGNRFLDRDGASLAVDYAALASALGCRGVRVEDGPSLAQALREAREGDRTTVIRCPVVDGEVPGSGAFWDLGVPEVASDEAACRRFARELERRRDAGQRRFA